MALIETWLNCDTTKLVTVKALDGNVFNADNEGNLLGVYVSKKGQPVELSGSVMGYVIRPDGGTVTVPGLLSENRAWIVLPQSAYAVIGQISIAIRLVNGSEKTVLAACTGYVNRTTTDTIIDPGHVVPSLEELLAQIEACQTAATAATTAAGAANTAASNADAKATLANTAAGNADAKATLANTAAGRADDAAAALENMTATATGLAAGSAPTVNVTEENGHYLVEFGIPKGDTGEVSQVEFDDLKSAIGDLQSNIAHKNLFNKDTVIPNSYVNAEQGIVLPLNGYNASQFIDISGLSAVKISNIFIVCYYNSAKTFISSYVPNPSAALYTLTIPDGTVYLRVTVANAYLSSAQIGEDISRSNYVPYSDFTMPNATILTSQIEDAAGSGFTDAVMSPVDTAYGRKLINRFNKNDINAGYYVNADTGELVSNSAFFASNYIDISDLSYVACCKTHVVAFYDASKAYISGQGFNTIDSDGSIARPLTAKYMRFSTYNANLSTAQIGKTVSSANYVAYGKYTLDNYETVEQEIIVDINGAGDYTSLTEALYENVDSGVTIRVMPGTYDLHAEYIVKWGATAVNSMADSDESMFHGFQFGAIIRDRKIIFEAGSFVTCDYTYQSDGETAQTVNGTHRICAFRVDYNADVYGLDLSAKHVFYAIHDDYGLISTPYTNRYENCKIVGVNMTNSNVLGGGCKKFSTHILKNCYFDNNSSLVTARFHNTLYAGAVPNVFISNCYFNSAFKAAWYGTQTTKMKVYVNNCHATTIYAGAESADATVENVELYKWCNEETGV